MGFVILEPKPNILRGGLLMGIVGNGKAEFKSKKSLLFYSQHANSKSGSIPEVLLSCAVSYINFKTK